MEHAATYSPEDNKLRLYPALGGSDGVPFITAEQARDIAVPCHERTTAHAARWIDHLSNRLAYERAMLQDAGGIATDKTGPEKGGAARCWVRQGWCEIVKVNRVSVTIMDNWGNGGKDFPRTVPFTDLKEVITKAEYDAIKAGGAATELGNNTIDTAV